MRDSMDGVVLAGGNGTRLWPLTATKPKPLIKVAGKTLMHRVMENLKQHVDRYVVVYSDERVKQEAMNIGSKLDKEVVCVEQINKPGTAAAVLSVKDVVPDRFIVESSDHIVDSNIYKDLKKLDEGILVKECSTPQHYGVVIVKDERIENIEEKPENPKSNLINIGIYLFTRDVFKELEKVKPSKRGEYEITDILEGKRCIKTDKAWYDVGMPWHLLDTLEFIINNEEKRVEGELKNCDVEGKIIVEEKAVLKNSTIIGPCYIGKSCKVGPYSLLHKACIEEGVEIGIGTTVKRSLIGKESKAKHLSYIGDSVVGEHVNFGSSTQIANLRFDGSTVKVKTKSGVIDTKRRKMGAIIGDNVKFGVNVSVMPGKCIKPNAWVMPNRVVDENIE